MSDKKYLKLSDIKNIQIVAEDFSHFLLRKEKISHGLKENPIFQAGVNHGIISSLLLLNDFLLDSEGELKRENIDKVLSKIIKKQQSLL